MNRQMSLFLLLSINRGNGFVESSNFQNDIDQIDIWNQEYREVT